MVIFDDVPRSDPRPCLHQERRFAFYDRVDDPVFERIRTLINRWFSCYLEDAADGEDARADLRRRFRSNIDTDFDSAFWELYLHETHHRAGYEVVPHPGSSTGKKPDFLMTRKDDRLYLEAPFLPRAVLVRLRRRGRRTSTTRSTRRLAPTS